MVAPKCHNGGKNSQLYHRGGKRHNRLSVEIMMHFFIVSARGHSLCCTRMHTQKQKYWCAVDICMDQLVKRLENLIANIFYMNVG